MEPLCLGKPSDPGRSGKDNRTLVEAVLWIARPGPSLARSAARFRPLECRVHAFPRLGEGVRVETPVRLGLGRAGRGIRHGRRHDRQGPLPPSKQLSNSSGCNRRFGRHVSLLGKVNSQNLLTHSF